MRNQSVVLAAVIVVGAGLQATSAAGAQPAVAHAPVTSMVAAGVPSAAPLPQRASRPRARLSVTWKTRDSGRVRVVAKTNARRVLIRYRNKAGNSRTVVRKVRAKSARASLPAGAQSVKARTKANRTLRTSQWQHAVRKPSTTTTPASLELTPTPAPATPAGGAEAPTAWEREVVALVNAARAQARKCGSTSYSATTPVTVNAKLTESARAHSRDMAVKGFFSHTGLDGSLPWDRMRAAGYDYRAAGENIAAGQSSPASAMSAWLGSSGHCANIMSPKFTEIGVGHIQRGDTKYGHYWTQNFGRR